MTCTLSAVCRRSKRRPSLLRAACVGLLCLGLGVASWAAPAHKDKDLHIYFVDVEGGQATLFVTPAGQSLLIDTGWPGNDGRDADRIVATARKAGISKIDYVLITHFHEDHVGGVPQLAARIPVGTFIDHGENRETTDAGTVKDWQAYQAVLATGKYKHIIAKPGDVLPVKGMRATVISSDGALIEKPLPGAGQENPNCKDAEQYPADTTENLRSLGTLINFGKLRILDLGDLTHDKEMQLVCPINKIGKIDIYIVSHHGTVAKQQLPLLYTASLPAWRSWTTAPRRAALRRSGTSSRKSPGLEDLWQLHFSEEGGAAHNVAAEFIANPDGPDAANDLELTAHPDGSFEVFNSRTQKSKTLSGAMTHADVQWSVGSTAFATQNRIEDDRIAALANRHPGERRYRHQLSGSPDASGCRQRDRQRYPAFQSALLRAAVGIPAFLCIHVRGRRKAGGRSWALAADSPSS